LDTDYSFKPQIPAIYYTVLYSLSLIYHLIYTITYSIFKGAILPVTYAFEMSLPHSRSHVCLLLILFKWQCNTSTQRFHSLLFSTIWDGCHSLMEKHIIGGTCSAYALGHSEIPYIHLIIPHAGDWNVPFAVWTWTHIVCLLPLLQTDTIMCSMEELDDSF